MEKIYSKSAEKVGQKILIHIINRLDDIVKGRRDLSHTDEFLQIATLNLEKGKTFYPHKHLHNLNEFESTRIAQESWIVIKGRIRVILYDLDDEIIKDEILMPGDASITFYGGHNYECLEEGSIVYEVKTGPYLGVEFDKVKI